MSARRRRRWITIQIFLYAVLVLISLGVYAYTVFSQSERVIAGYCSPTLVGMTLSDATRTATDLGLVAKPYRSADSTKKSLSIESDGSVMSGASTCTLDHDGQRITGVSHNPWYH